MGKRSVLGEVTWRKIKKRKRAWKMKSVLHEHCS